MYVSYHLSTTRSRIQSTSLLATTSLMAWLMLLPSICLRAQSPILDAYVQQGLDNNLTLRNADLTIQRYEEQVRQAKGLLYPSVSFEATYTRAVGGRRIAIPVGDLLNPVYRTLNQITQSSQFPQIENVNEQFLPDNFHDTRLRITQPLFNSDIHYNRRLREESIAIPTAERAAMAHQLRYDIITAYYRYLQALEAQRIYQASRGVVLELHRVTQRLVDNHKLTRDALYNTEYELSKIDSELAKAEKNVHLSSSYFNFLIQRDLSEHVLADTLLWAAPPPPPADLEAYIQQALTARHEPEQLAAAMQVNQTLLAMQEHNRKLPTLGMAVDAGAQGFGYRFDGEQWYALAGLQLSWPIFSGFQKQSKEQQTRIQGIELANQQELLRRQISLQVTAAWHERQAAEKNLQQATKAVDSARSAFRIVQRKYEEQQAIQLELFDARNKVTTAEISLSIARLELLLKDAELRRVGGL